MSICKVIFNFYIESDLKCVYVPVVFGKVTEGMGVVKRMELCGSRTGKTIKPVTIAACGQVLGGNHVLRASIFVCHMGIGVKLSLSIRQCSLHSDML